MRNTQWSRLKKSLLMSMVFLLLLSMLFPIAYAAEGTAVLDDEEAYVQNYIDYILNDGYQLINNDGLLSDITWSIISGDAEIVEGWLQKPRAEGSIPSAPAKKKTV